MNVTCPYSDGGNIFPCTRQDIFDRILTWTGRRPFVCATCKVRFVVREADVQFRVPVRLPVVRHARRGCATVSRWWIAAA